VSKSNQSDGGTVLSSVSSMWLRRHFSGQQDGAAVTACWCSDYADTQADTLMNPLSCCRVSWRPGVPGLAAAVPQGGADGQVKMSLGGMRRLLWAAYGAGAGPCTCCHLRCRHSGADTVLWHSW
jgi:hypothetical protein